MASMATSELCVLTGPPMEFPDQSFDGIPQFTPTSGVGWVHLDRASRCQKCKGSQTWTVSLRSIHFPAGGFTVTALAE